MFLEKRIREKRLAKDLTQEELGALLNVTKVSVCHWEKGLKRPSSKNLIALSKALNTDLEYLIGNDNYVVASSDNKYGLMMAKEEINIIKELRNYPELHELLTENPKRTLQVIDKNIVK